MFVLVPDFDQPIILTTGRKECAIRTECQVLHRDSSVSLPHTLPLSLLLFCNDLSWRKCKIYPLNYLVVCLVRHPSPDRCSLHLKWTWQPAPRPRPASSGATVERGCRRSADGCPPSSNSGHGLESRFSGCLFEPICSPDPKQKPH